MLVCPGEAQNHLILRPQIERLVERAVLEVEEVESMPVLTPLQGSPVDSGGQHSRLTRFAPNQKPVVWAAPHVEAGEMVLLRHGYERSQFEARRVEQGDFGIDA